MIFSADETTDIGYESGTPVSPDYTAGTSRFTGKIDWVQIDLGDDDHDHLIDPDEVRRVAMLTPVARAQRDAPRARVPLGGGSSSVIGCIGSQQGSNTAAVGPDRSGGGVTWCWKQGRALAARGRRAVRGVDRVDL